MVERSLRMREARGSIPRNSNFSSLLFYFVVFINWVSFTHKVHWASSDVYWNTTFQPAIAIHHLINPMLNDCFFLFAKESYVEPKISSQKILFFFFNSIKPKLYDSSVYKLGHWFPSLNLMTPTAKTSYAVYPNCLSNYSYTHKIGI